jgi:hypothetical protein
MKYIDALVSEEQLIKFLTELNEINLKYGLQYFTDMLCENNILNRLKLTGGVYVLFKNLTTELCLLQMNFINEPITIKKIRYSHQIQFLSCIMGTSLYNNSLGPMIFKFENSLKDSTVLSIIKDMENWIIKFETVKF